MAEDNRFKLRIVDSGMVRVTDIKRNKKNWRKHPKYQKELMGAILKQTGYTERLMVNRVTGNLINGHMRYDVAIENGEEEVPVDWVDLTPEEEEMELATHDPISMFAVSDRIQHKALLAGIDDEDGALERLLSMYDTEDRDDTTGAVKLMDDMELAAFEGYDYVVLLFKNQLDWITILDKLNVEKARIAINLKGQDKSGLGRVVDGRKVLEMLK